MRFLLLFVITVLFANKPFAQLPLVNSHTRIYLVRHAEKETGNDPALTKDGMKRAGDLFRWMKEKKLKRIYVTKYRRTQMTGDSLRIHLKIDTIHYAADTLCDDLVARITEHRDQGNTILIIGHSNTLPKIIRKLGVANYPQANIPDDEFDNLFLLTYKKSKAVIKKMKYGNKSGVSASMQ